MNGPGHTKEPLAPWITIAIGDVLFLMLREQPVNSFVMVLLVVLLVVYMYISLLLTMVAVPVLLWHFMRGNQR
jgi:hypothetical protein